MQAITVFLALRSRLWRAHLRTSLSNAPSLLVVGEAGDAARALEAMSLRPPQILLGDEEILSDLTRDPLPHALAALHLVRVTASHGTETLPPEQPVSGTVLLSASPKQIVATLAWVAAPSQPPLPPRLSDAVRERFHFTGPAVSRSLAPSGATAPPGAPAPLRPRATNPALERLRAALAALQRDRFRFPRDATSGLSSVPALRHALRLVTDTGYATAIVVAEVQDAPGVATAAVDAGLIRKAGALLRASVRPGDLICRAGPALFVLLLPGLARADAGARVDRLLEALRSASGARSGGRDIAMQSVAWQPGLEPVTLLAQCVLALRQTPFGGDDRDLTTGFHAI